jgi:succinate-semialdehyde dehydrogenase/glutarate-semialdehyde dehydrogenase
MLQTINPATGQTVAEHPEMSAREVGAVLRASTRAFAHWSRTDFTERSALLNTVAEGLMHRREELARLITIEMGKPVQESRAEIEKCARTCRHYARHAAEMLADRTESLEAIRAIVTHRPLGPLLAIMPWNFPFWQVFRAAAPALMAGNTVVLKHASNTTGCALAIESSFRAAGFPEGTFRVLRLAGSRMTRVVKHRAVAAVTLTGSTTAGRKIAAAAGAALKKTVLELGGSDAYVVLEDADLDLAARVCAKARLINNGQSCVAAKRFVVVASVHDAFLEKLVHAMDGFVRGDPLRDDTQLGPMARPDLRDELHQQVRRSVDAGARLVLGGEMPEGPGAFYPATVLAEVEPGMAAFDEETFGPVAAVVRAKDEKHALALAARTSFGLGAAVFTRDAERGLRIAREELRAGVCAVNTLVASDPRVPFGGIGDSGYGRELGTAGIREFVNTKTMLVG